MSPTAGPGRRRQRRPSASRQQGDGGPRPDPEAGCDAWKADRTDSASDGQRNVHSLVRVGHGERERRSSGAGNVPARHMAALALVELPNPPRRPGADDTPVAVNLLCLPFTLAVPTVAPPTK